MADSELLIDPAHRAGDVARQGAALSDRITALEDLADALREEGLPTQAVQLGFIADLLVLAQGQLELVADQINPPSA